MEKEKYQPTKDEIMRAENTMTDRQRESSKSREKISELIKKIGHEGILCCEQKTTTGNVIKGKIDGLNIEIANWDSSGATSIKIDGEEIPEEAVIIFEKKYNDILREVMLESYSKYMVTEEAKNMPVAREWTSDKELNLKINKILG